MAVGAEVVPEEEVGMAVAMPEVGAVAMPEVGAMAMPEVGAMAMDSDTPALTTRLQPAVPVPKTLGIKEQLTMDGLFQPTAT
jgi:hypothetical protein